MRQELPALPARVPNNRAVAATLKLWAAGKAWAHTDDPTVLRQIADGLRALPHDYPTAHCRSEAPIRSYAHAYQVMDVHARHHCSRYTAAAEFAKEARP